MSIHKLQYTLQLADNALILGHRISEWCGHGPILEQDIAITNTALDHLGQARSLYQYAAELFNSLPQNEKDTAFTYFQLAPEKTADEDTLPYLRDAGDYKNVLLVEQANEDWAYTVVRSFYYDTFMVLFYNALTQSNDAKLVAIAEKSLKEAQYHQKWSSEWVIRLGDGTGESHEKVQAAVNDLWVYTGELFIESEADQVAKDGGYGVVLADLVPKWQQQIKAVLEEATLTLPDPNIWMHRGGKTGQHSENLGYILADLQYVQRAYPDMKW
jgi:ring-1,2-phenylacetyl-CoA epoxidase subunit PaaC